MVSMVPDVSEHCCMVYAIDRTDKHLKEGTPEWRATPLRHSSHTAWACLFGLGGDGGLFCTSQHGVPYLPVTEEVTSDIVFKICTFGLETVGGARLGSVGDLHISLRARPPGRHVPTSQPQPSTLRAARLALPMAWQCSQRPRCTCAPRRWAGSCQGESSRGRGQ